MKRLNKNFFTVGAVLVCFLLLLPTYRFLTVDAQQTPVDASREHEVEMKIRTFFDGLKREIAASASTSPAFDELLRQSPFSAPGAGSQLVPLRTRVDEMKKDFGEILNWEKHEIKQFGTDVVVVRYVLKHDSYPVMWSFTFYRKPSTSPTSPIIHPWVLVELQVETNFR